MFVSVALSVVAIAGGTCMGYCALTESQPHTRHELFSSKELAISTAGTHTKPPLAGIGALPANQGY